MVIEKYEASWCHSCQQLKPIMEEIGQRYDDVDVVTIDVENDPDKATNNNVKGLPTLIFKDAGNELKRITGLKDKQEYINTIEELK